jgi:hypothetical protein
VVSFLALIAWNSLKDRPQTDHDSWEPGNRPLPLAEGSELRKYYRRTSGNPPEPELTFEERMRELLGMREG